MQGYSVSLKYHNDKKANSKDGLDSSLCISTLVSLE